MAVYEQSEMPLDAPVGALWITSEPVPVIIGAEPLTFGELAGRS
jgi:hypothetical protein